MQGAPHARRDGTNSDRQLLRRTAQDPAPVSNRIRGEDDERDPYEEESDPACLRHDFVEDQEPEDELHDRSEVLQQPECRQ